MSGSLPEFAISIRQPWAWMILHAGKDIENRTWKTNFRGRVFIHASQGVTKDEYHEAFEVYDFIRGYAPDSVFSRPGLQDLDRGGIVGVATITDCVSMCESPWFFGPWGFVLADVEPLPFRPCKGALGFFKVGGVI